MVAGRAAQIVSEVLDAATAVNDVPQGLLVACVGALPVTGVGLSLMTAAGAAGTVAASDETAAAMEDSQFTLGDGPAWIARLGDNRYCNRTWPRPGQ